MPSTRVSRANLASNAPSDQRRPDANPDIAHVGPIGSEVVQRVLTYRGKQFNIKKDIYGDKTGAYEAYTRSTDPDKERKLLNKVRLYDLEDGLKDVTDKDVMIDGRSEATKRGEGNALKTREIDLEVEIGPEVEKRSEDYPEDATLYAPIDHAILVINEGPYKFVGTGGLIGCVEVMIEYQTKTDKGYLVAHVSSDIEDDEEEVRRQLTLMLTTLGKELDEEIHWSDFTGESATNKLTLVRSRKLMEQKLLIHMVNILAESGASMRLLNTTSATMEITATGAKYYNNQKDVGVTPPKMDYRASKGYPFSEQ
jgi:hypothetical protein